MPVISNAAFKGCPASSTARPSAFWFPGLGVFKLPFPWERFEFRNRGWGFGGIFSATCFLSSLSAFLAAQVVRPHSWGVRGRKVTPPVLSPRSPGFHFPVTGKQPRLLHLSSVQWVRGPPRRIYPCLAFPPPLSWAACFHRDLGVQSACVFSQLIVKHLFHLAWEFQH